MKISKYDHTRTAVGFNKESKRTEGVLYMHPGSVVEPDARIREKNRSYRILYNFFVPIQVGNQPQEPEKKDWMDDKTFERWINYHFATCERQDLVGASHHTLDILRKDAQMREGSGKEVIADEN